MTGGVYSACGEMKEIVADEVGRTVVADERDPVAEMDQGEPRLGNEEPHEDVFRRQQRHHRPAGRDGLAGAGENVGDDAADRRDDVALVEPPLQHVDRRARGFGGRLLRLDLALAPERRPHLRQRRLEALHLGIGGAQVGALLVDELDRHRVGF